ncbi:uncharacterized protein MONOS_18688 [Monocercomonoides exilis]|uniref:uncharacterized protein n=1 Tax=Monocercomonoides exilis TaxID=2049356 RepID=UPI00355A5D19|nr:hypothetical protein MONOS_18688 [Monocercomonoides exilis]
MLAKERMTRSVTKRFYELFSELEDCDEEDQRQKILEMNEMIDGMNKEEIGWTFTKKLFNEIDKMIEEKKISLENAILLLKRVGYWKEMQRIWNLHFDESALNRRFEEMIIDEDKKKEGKIEKFLDDLCKCYSSLSFYFSSELSLICVSCLLKVASNRKEDNESQKEAEMELLALSNIEYYVKIDKELYLNEIKEIIKYHQEHHNLTRLAYQSTWKFLMNRFYRDKSLEDVIANELHFVREAAKELEELMKCVDWKKNEKKGERKEKEEMITILRWCKLLRELFDGVQEGLGECSDLLGCLVCLFRAARNNQNDLHRELCNDCIYCVKKMYTINAISETNFLEGAANLFVEEISQSTLNRSLTEECLSLLGLVSKRLKGKTSKESEEKPSKTERKMIKRKIFERFEEEGYEDEITKRYETIFWRYFLYGLSKDVNDYYVYC